MAVFGVRPGSRTIPSLGAYRVEVPTPRAKRSAAEDRRGVCLSFGTTGMPLAPPVEPGWSRKVDQFCIFMKKNFLICVVGTISRSRFGVRVTSL